MKQPHILIVEDETLLSDAFSIMLQKEGYNVSVAGDGQQALDLIAQSVPNLILLDILMPIMDGKTFLKEFKNTTHIPIIVFSNVDRKNEVEEVMSLGATRFMLKSWSTPRKLLDVVTNSLKSGAPA
jgi:CheY-like chemotaxis protein